jgi:transposase
MRKSFDGLLGVTMQVFQRNPVDGHLFLFLNRRRDRIKLMWWDHDGLAVFYKRLEAGTYEMPAAPPDAQGIEIDVTQFAVLLSGIESRSAKRRKRYVRVA